MRSSTRWDETPSNVGIVEPNHKGGSILILTYDIVHRTPIDIQGYYYPRVFTDWYADDWITGSADRTAEWRGRPKLPTFGWFTL